MSLSYKARRRWSLVILLIGLPAYIVAVIALVNLFDRPGVLSELLIYVALGIVWALPFRAVFRGIGKPDPEKSKATIRHPASCPSGCGHTETDCPGSRRTSLSG